MKTYLVRYLPIQYTEQRPGAVEIIVQAENERQAYAQIPEKYSGHSAQEIKL